MSAGRSAASRSSGGLATDGFAGVDFADDELADCFAELGGAEAGFLYAVEFGVDCGGGGVAFGVVAGVGDVKEAVGAGGPACGIDGVDEGFFLADGLPE